MRVVVIGADACGASAASGVKRRCPDADVLVLERQPWTSYAACGIPFWIGGLVDGPDALIARTPEQHRANGLDLRTGWEATVIDPDGQTVAAQQLSTGAQETFTYDHLVIATGSSPRRPPIPGIDLAHVYGVQTIDDGLRALDGLSAEPRTAVVVGAGYIGVEMAEAMSLRGLEVTVVDQAPQPMSTLDPDLGCLIAEAMAERGMVYRGGEKVTAISPEAVTTDAGSYPADVVILGLGVTPNTALAREAGLPLGEAGGLLTDDRQRVTDTIWAGGDCVEVRNRITGQFQCIPLGTHANKHGRVIGENIGGGDLRFPGVVGTAVTKICHLEIGRTGLGEQQAVAAGFEVVSAVITSKTRAGYFPGADPIHVKAIAERGTGRLLGCQIVGGQGAAKRIDAAATAIWHGMTVEEVTSLDLGYAPPFSPVWDPVQIATRQLVRRV